MDTIDITAIGDRFATRIAVSRDAACRHFSIEMDGGMASWGVEPEFICTNCRAKFSRERALIIREMHEMRT